MDAPTFFIKFIEFGAWPAAAVAIVLLLRRELQAVIPMIKTFQAGPVKIELERVVKELEATKKVAAAADAKAQVVAAKLDEADDNAESGTRSLAWADSIAALQIAPVERQVLKAITESRFATRSITGVAKDTGLSRAIVQVTYGKLIEKGLLEQTKNDDEKLRWYPTSLGRVVANEG